MTGLNKTYTVRYQARLSSLESVILCHGQISCPYTDHRCSPEFRDLPTGLPGVISIHSIHLVPSIHV